MTTVNPVQTTAYTLKASNDPIVFGAGTRIKVVGASGVGGDPSGSWTMTNYGTISGQPGVYLGGNDASLTNRGTIEGVGGSGGVWLQNVAHVDNSGLISGPGAYGVILYAGGTILNEASGTIYGASAISFGPIHVPENGRGTITNYGVVSGYNDGVLGPVGLDTVFNSGTITGLNAGVVASFIVGDGVGLHEGGVVVNRAAGSISGARYGVYISGAAGTVTNFGEISGTKGAVDLASATDRLIVEDGSKFVGAVKGGAGALELAGGTGTITGLGAAGTLSGATAMQFSGFHSYQIDAGSHWTVAGVDTLGAGLTLTDAGDLTVTGSVSGAVGVAVTGATGVVTNFGTIKGTGGTAVTLAAATEELVVEAKSVFVGKVLGDGGVLDLATGVGALTGLLAGGTVTVSGSMPTTTFSDFDTVEIGAGASFTASKGGSIAAGQSLIDDGALSVGGALSIAGKLTTAGTLSGAGTVTLTSAVVAFDGGTRIAAHLALAKGSMNVDGAVADSGALTAAAATTLAIAAADTLTLTGTGSTLAGKVSGAGTLVFAGGTQALDAGASLSTAKVSLAGASVVAVDEAKLTYVGVWTQTAGTLSVAAADRVTFTGVGDSFTGTLGGAGTVVFSGGSDALKGTTLSAGALSVSGSTVTLSGAITLDHTLTATTPNLIVAATGAKLSGGGTVSLSNSAANRIYGATASATLTNADDTIKGAGLLGDGKLVLVNDAAGVIDGAGTAGLTIDTGTSAIVNAGTIEATLGVTTIAGAVRNSGTLEAAKGVLVVDGAVSGAGKAVISAGTADFASTFSQSVAFTGTTGVLELGHSLTYKGSITGFSTKGTTSLDLLDVAFISGTTKASYAGTATAGTLTVTDGTHTARIKLTGDYLTSTFTVATDGHGGTKIVDPQKPAAAHVAASAPVHPFIAAVGSFAPMTAGTGGIGEESWRPPPPTLARPGGQIA